MNGTATSAMGVPDEPWRVMCKRCGRVFEAVELVDDSKCKHIHGCLIRIVCNERGMLYPPKEVLKVRQV